MLEQKLLELAWEKPLLEHYHYFKSEIGPFDFSARDVNLNESSESSSDELKNQLISFSKYRLLVEFVSDLLQYQSVPYKFRLHQRMRSFLNEDIDNYFDSAMNANSNSFNFGGIGNNETATQSVETWLFDKSKLIEPNNDKMG